MNEDKAREAFDVVREALPEFSQQDDYLLAHGASLMSEDSHEIVHVDTVRKIVAAALQWAASQQAAEGRVMREAYEQLRHAWSAQNARTPGQTNYGLEQVLRDLRERLDDPGSPWWRTPPSTQGGADEQR